MSFFLEQMQCISRCVRRAFLCGFDSLTEKGYEHRRKWIEDRISFLTSLFCIEIYSYAIMSNHFHVVLATDFKKAVALSDREIARRWLALTAKQRNEDGNPIQATVMTVEALLANPDAINLYRSRLSDVSWFMRYFNEWVESVSRYGSLFYYFAGKLEHLIEAMRGMNRDWCWGKRGSEQIYRSAS